MSGQDFYSRPPHHPQRLEAMHTMFGVAILQHDRACWALFALAPCGCRDFEPFGPPISDGEAVEIFAVQPLDPA